MPGTGSDSGVRDKIATPLYERCPLNATFQPAASSSVRGNTSSGVLVSCSAITSIGLLASQVSNCGRRKRNEFTFQVAIFTLLTLRRRVYEGSREDRWTLDSAVKTPSPINAVAVR